MPVPLSLYLILPIAEKMGLIFKVFDGPNAAAGRQSRPIKDLFWPG